MVEKIKYSVIDTFDDIEIRKYPSVLVVSMFNNNDSEAFNFLFDYIQGNNKLRKKVPMTAPVLSSEKIPMTAPVLSTKQYMAFFLPEHYTKDTAPIPNNAELSIEEIPERILAVIRFGGRSNNKTIDKNSGILKNQLQKKKMKTTGNIFLLRYNSPFTPGFLRRNELAMVLTNFDEKN